MKLFFWRRATYLSPVVFLLLIYFLANLQAFFVAYNGGDVQVDQLISLFSPDVALLALVLICITFIFLLSIYFLNFRFVHGADLHVSNSWAWGLLFFQVFYAINAFYYGVNIAGVEDLVKSPFQMVFSFLDPDILFLIIAVSIKSPRFFWINTMIYIISSVLRGWGGAFVLIPILLLCRYYPVRVKGATALYLLLGFSSLLLLSPFLIEVKWLIRAGGDFSFFVDNVLQRGYLSSLETTVEYLLNRFQMFGHVALLVDNSDFISQAYDNDKFIPFWADGLPQWAILKLQGVEIIQLNRYMVSVFFAANNSAYSTNPGLAGWLSVLNVQSGVFLFFVFSIVFFPAYLVRKYAGMPRFMLLYSFVFIYLFHGWIGAYINFIIYMLGILFFQKIRYECVRMV